ncbi:MAG: hypothetical protein WAN13_13140 [Candidatus Acidiferrales bacterium]
MDTKPGEPTPALDANDPKFSLERATRVDGSEVSDDSRSADRGSSALGLASSYLKKNYLLVIAI